MNTRTLIAAATLVTMLCVWLVPSVPVFGQGALSDKPGFKGATTNTGQMIQYPTTDTPEIIGRLMVFQPGEDTGWHQHRVPTYTHVVEGTLTIEFEDGTQKAYHAGAGLLAAMDAWHTGKNIETTPLKVVVVILGAEGTKPLIRRDQ